MKIRIFVPLLCLTFLQALSLAQYKVESIGACAAPEVADPIRGSLQPQGARLLDANGATICELWLRGTIPVKAEATGANYSDINAGTLIGLLHLTSGGADFRGQPIKAGFYTLRYERIPSDGNHMGASPYPDFALLVPAAIDKDLELQPKFEELVKLSRQASGTNHPAVLMLTPATGQGASPSLKQNEYGHWVVEIKTQAKPQGSDKTIGLSVAIVLVGKAEV